MQILRIRTHNTAHRGIFYGQLLTVAEQLKLKPRHQHRTALDKTKMLLRRT
jgi:hypothetical protein